MLMGMRIVARVREEYGDVDDDNVDVLNPWTNKNAKEDDAEAEAQKRIMDQRDEEMAGGFLPEGFNVEEPEEDHHRSFFPVAHEGDEDEDGGGFVVEDHDDQPARPTIGQAYATPQSLLSKSGKGQASEEDVEMQDAKLDVDADAPAPKKRGRPVGSTNKSTTTKAKNPVKRIPANQKTPASRSTGGRKILVPDSEEDDYMSSLSDIETGGSEAEELPTKVTKGRAGKRGTMPARTSETPRKTPKRSAARKSETALKSHYFEHSDDE
jgi:xeroderma pigmentosum group C-complementing protein